MFVVSSYKFTNGGFDFINGNFDLGFLILELGFRILLQICKNDYFNFATKARSRKVFFVPLCLRGKKIKIVN